jgi:hypothetical protein
VPKYHPLWPTSPAIIDSLDERRYVRLPHAQNSTSCITAVYNMLRGTHRPAASEDEIMAFELDVREAVVAYTAEGVFNGCVPGSWAELELAAVENSALPLQRSHLERLYGLGFNPLNFR